MTKVSFQGERGAYSEAAARGAENMGYRITAAADFQGDSIYYVYKKR